ncbi:lipopolysaccharide biosynthesis protein [Parathalassolituus penaei]|uniref:Polysaccharide biosynthesis protein n=1 Tax=Parathalassolituus penaei TaxID=2997323 RepID=A0A9X3IUG3_9GAMM|nr:oligosaccharide flippase family protein [Parathalassolituus penaei]MCY0966939.1 hypothetical protein [Parathalassolituus penaei]
MSIFETFKGLRSGIGANSYGQVVNIVIQLVSVPVFLFFWSAEEYGKWLLLVAIPSYLSMSDFGIANVVSNQMNMLSARGEWAAVNELFGGTLTLFFIILSAAFVLGGGIFYFDDASYVVVYVLCLNVILILSGNLIQAVFRCYDRYSSGVYWDVNSRLIEWVSSIVAVSVSKDFVVVALSMLFARVVWLVYAIVYLTKINGDIHFRFGRIGCISHLIKDSIRFSLIPLSNGINIQGFSILVGSLLGPVYLVVFNSYRTISRMAIQMVSIVSHSAWPKFSRMYGAGGAGIRDLYESLTAYIWVGVIALAICVFVFYYFFISYWTNGEVVFDPGLSAVFFIYSILGGGWHLSRILLISTNNHGKLALFMLLANAIALVIGFFSVNSVVDAVLILVALEFLLFVYSRKESGLLLSDFDK